MLRIVSVKDTACLRKRDDQKPDLPGRVRANDHKGHNFLFLQHILVRLTARRTFVLVPEIFWFGKDPRTNLACMLCSASDSGY
jgi:hypothetical protein